MKDESSYQNVGNLLTHVMRIERMYYLGPGETLFIYYDRTKTPPSAMREAMGEANRMFPRNKVIFVSSDYTVVKSTPWTKIPLKTDSLWERFKNLLYRAYKV